MLSRRPRKTLISKIFAGLAMLAAMLSTFDAVAQAYPAKPVRMILPFPPGGGTDLTVRLIGQTLQDQWGQSVVLEYKPGGGTVIATDAVAKSAPDGYTLGVVVSSHWINPSLLPSLPFDTVKDLSGVSSLANSHLVLVATNALEANNVAELIALAKKNPGKLSYATPGSGTNSHLAIELLKTMAGIDMLHVPYKGGALAYPDVIAGRVSLHIVLLQSHISNIRAGKVKPIGIISARRAVRFPNIPTFAETVPGFVVTSVNGVVVPSATPRNIVQRLSAELNRTLQSPALIERMEQMGIEAYGSTPEQFDAFIRSEIVKWAKVVKASGAKAD